LPIALNSAHDVNIVGHLSLLNGGRTIRKLSYRAVSAAELAAFGAAMRTLAADFCACNTQRVNFLIVCTQCLSEMLALSASLAKVKERVSFLESVIKELEAPFYSSDAITAFLNEILPAIDRANSALSGGCTSSLHVLQHGRNASLMNEGIRATFLDYILDPSEFELVGDEIGHGSFSVVFLGKRKSDGQLYAFKRSAIRKHRIEAYEPFYRELEILAGMHHETVLPLVGFTLSPAFMTVTPYMPLGSIEDALRRGVEFTEVQLLKIVFGVAVAMQYLHAHKVVHRDLKPENVFLDGDRVPVVADFGLSKLLTPEMSGLDPLAASRDIGTPIYTAPEILSDETYTKKSDVYSYGMVVYRLLCGRRPFADVTSLFDLRERVVGGIRPEIPEDVPTPYRDLIESCWQANPGDRPSFSFIVDRILRDGFPGATEEDFLTYNGKVGGHAVTGRVLQKDLLTFSRTPDLPISLALADSGPQLEPEVDTEPLDLPAEDEIAFLSSRPIIPGGYSPPQFPIPPLSTRHVLTPRAKPTVFAMKKSPSTPSPAIAPARAATGDAALRIRAAKGDREAQVQLAQHLRKIGRHAEAADYWEAAADAGAPVAQFYFAESLRLGLAGPPDIALALTYYRAAADAGIREAMYEYGVLIRREDETASNRYLHWALIRKCRAAQRWYGVREQRRGNAAKAAAYLRQAADQGDTEAQFLFGDMLKDGRGIPRDSREAERYLRLAARKEHGGALFSLAMLLNAIQPTESRALLERATAAKNKDAAFCLSKIRMGEGREAEGLALLQEAAERGHTEAMTSLAVAALEKDRSDRDALQMLESAVKNGSVVAAVQYAELTMNCDDPSAIECFRQAAARGNARAQFFYGRHLLKRGIVVDGVAQLRMAIEQGCREALWTLAEEVFFDDSEEARLFASVRGNIQELRDAAASGNRYAMYWLSKLAGDREMLREAAERGVPQAQCDLASAIRSENPREADGLLTKALAKNSSVAQLWFARMHLVNGSPDKGMLLLRRAAQQGNIEAQFEIGKQIFEPGLSRGRFEEALPFLKKAATGGYPPAMWALGKYMLANHDEGGNAYMREAAARGYAEPDRGGTDGE
jgi:serine/threonine protein kinase/TPR repeat protein